MRRSVLIAIMVLAYPLGVDAETTRANLDRLLDSSVQGWRFKLGDPPGAQAPEFDDSAWERVDVGHQWWPHDSVCWYRKRITMPETIHGVSAAGASVRLRVGVDNEAQAYVDGVSVAAIHVGRRRSSPRRAREPRRHGDGGPALRQPPRLRLPLPRRVGIERLRSNARSAARIPSELRPRARFVPTMATKKASFAGWPSSTRPFNTSTSKPSIRATPNDS